MNDASEMAGYAFMYIVLFWAAIWLLFGTGIGRVFMSLLFTLVIIIGVPLLLLWAVLL